MAQAKRAAESETLIPIQERVRKTSERLDSDFLTTATKIHRFPQGLRGISDQHDRYIVPSVVALGPYHHGSPHLHEMEEMKHVAARYFCEQSNRSVDDVYGKVLSVAGEARRYYAEDAVARFSAAEFAHMMFLDGCFLLYYISHDQSGDLLTNRMVLSTGPYILRDIFLLENQLPWLVLEALMTFTGTGVDLYYNFVANRTAWFSDDISKRLSFDEFHSYMPPHLLAHLRHYLIGSMPRQDLTFKGPHFSLASSAIELAEMGIKLTASNKPWFADMTIQKDPIFGELSLTSLFLNDFVACWLVNMAALEACTSTYAFDGYIICSHLSLLEMLMDKEEDVHELRAKHLVRSFFSNQEVLHFFKGLARHLPLGHRYFIIVEGIVEYKRERRLRIAVHKFLYNNYKVIAALVSIAGVLVGIFQTLVSLRQP